MVDLSLHALLSNPDKMFDRSDEVVQLRRGHVSGTLHWRIGYWPIWHAPLPDNAAEIIARESMFAIPPRANGDVPKIVPAADSRLRALVEASFPPPPERLTGLLAIHIHELADLEVPEARQSFADKPGKQQETSTANTPSSFCVISLNGAKLLTTRLKKLTAHPIINASYETFVANHQTAVLEIGVFDARQRGASGQCGLR